MLSVVDGAEKSESALCEVTRVIVSFILVQSSDCLHFFLCQLEVKHVDVLSETLRLSALWNSNAIALNSPTEANLSLRLIVFLGSSDDGFAEEAGVLSSRHVKLNVTQTSEVRETHDLQVSVLPRISEQLLLGEEGVQLDLEDGGLDLGVLEDIVDLVGVDVAAADVSREFLLDEGLHCVPGVLVASLRIENHLLVIGVHPLGRVLALDGHELLSDGEVNQVEIQVLELQILEGLLAGEFDLVGSVESVPQLGDDEKILSLDEALRDGAFDALTDLLLVTVVTSTVEESVASLNSLEDGLRAHVLANLPEAEAKEWHLIASSVKSQMLHVLELITNLERNILFPPSISMHLFWGFGVLK